MQGASHKAHTSGRTVNGLTPISLPYHPAFGGAIRYTLEARPQPEDDELSTAQTIARMAEYVREDARQPLIRQAAYEATRNAGNPRKEAAAIHRWIRSRVRFVQDAELAGSAGLADDAEVLVRPVDLLTMPDAQGDCDDFSMLAAAMLRARGIPASFKTIAADGAEPDLYSHVYVIAYLPCGPWALDASHGPYLGWEAQAAGKSRIWPIEDTMRKRLSGLGQETTINLPWATPTTPSGTVPFLQNLATSGLNIAGSILQSRFSVPQLAPGAYIQQGNAIYAQQQPGSSALAFPGVSVGGSTTTILLIGAAALVMVAVMSGRRN